MKNMLRRWSVAAAVALLAACGGGSDGGEAASPASIPLTGTAAIGAPLSNATVTIRGANGKELTGAADGTGAYAFADVSALTEPLMIRATGTAGGQEHTLYSVAADLPAPGQALVANVTPMTHAVLTQALGDAPSLEASIDISKLNLVKSQLATAMADVYRALSLSVDLDPFTAPFVANGAGLDKVLDLMAFNADPSGNEPIFYVVEKGTANFVKVEDSPSPLKAPQGAEIDTSGIKTLIDKFNSYAVNPEAKEFQDLFDEKFLDYGQSRADLFEALSTEDIELRIKDIAINGCKKVEGIGYCTVLGNMMVGNQSVERFEMPVVLVGGNWKLLGNQSPIDFDFKPVYFLSSDGQQILDRKSVAQNGFNLYIPVENAGFNVQSATLTFVVNGVDREPSLSFNKIKDCEFLSFGQQGCSNLVVFQNANQPQQLNNAIAAGQLYARIDVKTIDGENKSHQFLVNTPFFTSASGDVAHKITVTGVGTQEVKISGNGSTIDYVSVFVNSSYDGEDGSHNWWGNASWEGEQVAALSGVVSVSKVNAYCDGKYFYVDCDKQFSNEWGRIQQVFISGRDALGRGLWLSLGNQTIE